MPAMAAHALSSIDRQAIKTSAMRGYDGSVRPLPGRGAGGGISSWAAPGTASGPGARAGLDGLKTAGASRSSFSSASSSEAIRLFTALLC